MLYIYIYIYKDLLLSPNKSFILDSANIYNLDFNKLFSPVGKDWFCDNSQNLFSVYD